MAHDPTRRTCFPVMAGRWLTAVPWAYVAEHAPQAMQNHAQSLEHLAQRGGLQASELLAVLEDRPWYKLPQYPAECRLMALVIHWLYPEEHIDV